MTTSNAVLQQRDEQLQRDVDRMAALVETLRADLAACRQENAVLKSRQDAQDKRSDTWAGRAWALVTVLVGALLSLASGLIVTLARR